MAEMWTVTIKNGGGAAVLIEDLGIEIGASSQEDLHLQFTYDEIAGSDDLRDLVNAGTLVVNDGTADLSAANGVEYLSLENLYHLAENHYSKTELQTSGQAQVDWGNIINTPSFGSPTWIDPVLFRAMSTNQATPPASAAATGDLDSLIAITAAAGLAGNLTINVVGGGSGGAATVSRTGSTLTVTIEDGVTTQQTIATALEGRAEIDTATPDTAGDPWTIGAGTDTVDLTGGQDDPEVGSVYVDNNHHYQKYNGASWDDLGLAQSGDRVINLSSPNQGVETFNGATWDETAPNPADYDNTAVMVDDDGDGGQAQYSFSTSDMTWKKIGDVDFSGHFDGAAGKHDASEIDVENNYTNLGISAPTDLESALGNIDTAVGAVSSAAASAQADATQALLDAAAAAAAAAAAQSDIDGHLDGGASKHDASEIDVEGTYSNIPGTPGDLETALAAIDTAIGTLADSASTLDEAYDGGVADSGSGRTITVDQGAVKLAASGGYAPLELVPLTTAPNTDLQNGQIAMRDDGLMYTYDAGRSKWLSIQRLHLTFGRKGRTKNQYLNFFAGSLPSNNTGARLFRNATVVAMAGQFDASNTGSFLLRDDGQVATATLAVATAIGLTALDTDVDFSAGDLLQCFFQSATRVEDPLVIVELAWRW